MGTSTERYSKITLYLLDFQAYLVSVWLQGKEFGACAFELCGNETNNLAKVYIKDYFSQNSFLIFYREKRNYFDIFPD